ncbi:MAG: class I SAM-dependent methyltransferase [Ferruginibacter sp.]|nr:class I SAM-dependent methyltransferase [Rhodoferax sp.]
MQPVNICLICHQSSLFIFKNELLGKYEVSYFRCGHCGCLQTEKPYWLDEAYEAAITSLDVGMVGRNISLAQEAARIIGQAFDARSRFLDYAGGYGLFVRMMRDKGFDFYRSDRYCTNIFARHLDLKDLEPDPVFELVTAFEVLEHLVDPIAEVEKILGFSDSLLFSTLLVPAHLKQIKNWWYLTPETGQHIVFFTVRTLEILAEHLGCQLFSNGSDLHLLTKRKMADPFVEKKKSMAVRVAQKYLRWAAPSDVTGHSLLAQDFEAARRRLAKTLP